MPTGGLELLPSGAKRRKWNWRGLDSSARCNPFPEIYPLVLGVGCDCAVRIFSQHNISLTFSVESRSCRFRVGARLVKVSVDMYMNTQL